MRYAPNRGSLTPILRLLLPALFLVVKVLQILSKFSGCKCWQRLLKLWCCIWARLRLHVCQRLHATCLKKSRSPLSCARPEYLTWLVRLKVRQIHRQGGLSAEALQEDFARALHDCPAAPALFADLASILPPGPQRAGLRAAAARYGWDTSPNPNPMTASSTSRAALLAPAFATDTRTAVGRNEDQPEAGGPNLENLKTLEGGWAPLDRSSITARANELAGGPSGGPGVEAAAVRAAQLSAGKHMFVLLTSDVICIWTGPATRRG